MTGVACPAHHDNGALFFPTSARYGSDVKITAAVEFELPNMRERQLEKWEATAEKAAATR